MPEQRSVSINQKDFYRQGLAYGILCRVYFDLDKGRHSKPSVALLSGVSLLPKDFDQETFEMAFACCCEVLMYRKIMAFSDHPILFPEWDPEDKETEDIRELADLFLMVYAFQLAHLEEDLPPEQCLGPIFTLSGAGIEGVRDGFRLLSEEGKKTYEELTERIASSMDTITTQLDFLEQRLNQVPSA